MPERIQDEAVALFAPMLKGRRAMIQ